MRQHRGVGIVVAALLVLGVTACGGDDGDRAALPNACDLLTTEEAEDLLGVPTTAGSEDTDRTIGGTYCEWVSEDTDDGGDASDAGSDSDVEPYFISVEVDQGEGAVQRFASGKADEGEADDEGPAYEPVEGLGDDAYFDVTGGLEVRKGDIVFSTYTRSAETHPLTRAEQRDIERRAADIIVERVGEGSSGTDIAAATECGETGRCIGTRYRACDLIDDAVIEEVTGLVVDDVDGQIVRTESENGGICDWTLSEPTPETSSRARSVEIFVEPDADAAEAKYTELREDAERDDAFEPVPELGSDAFTSPGSSTVIVLHDGKLLEVTFQRDLPDFTTDTSPEARQIAIAVAAKALEPL